MMKTIRNTTLSALALMLVLNVPITASYSDEEDSPKGGYSVGKKNDWDNQSVASRAFSDRKGPAVSKKKPFKDEELSYGPDDEWERETVRSGLDDIKSSVQKLADIPTLKRYFFKGNLDITPQNYETLLEMSNTLYGSSFESHDKGIIVKGWKASSGFYDLLEILLKFKALKSMKVTITWDTEADAGETLARAIQYYEDLTELDIANCKLSETGITDILDSIAHPEQLKSLDISGNKASAAIIERLKKQFSQLASLKSDIPLQESKSLNTLSLESLNLTSTTKAQPATVSSVPTTILPQKKPLLAAYAPTPFPVSPDEQGLPSDLLMKAKVGDPAAQTEIAVLYVKGETVGQNSTKAYEWFTKAANQGNTTAQVYLGWMHLEGKGVKQDDSKALELYQKAASLGNNEAQQWIEWMRQQGRGFSVMKFTIPPVAKEYEDIYKRFLKGALIYRPNEGSDVGMIKLPIAQLANPLEGTFDLSQCGDAGQYLSISTGYRKGKKAENANKLEIWFAPRFLIEKELETTASQFKVIMSGWSDTRPVGIFWTWGGWDVLYQYDHQKIENMDTLSNNTLYEIWRTTPPQPAFDYIFPWATPQCKKFHVHFVN